MRALICIRLSRVTDATTSPERQLAACRELCRQRGYEVVGVAEDLDVSAGKTSPFDRPQLGGWLRTPEKFDALVFFRVDRLVRRLFDLSDMIRWAREHRVTLVSATESYFDLSAEFGDIIALLVAKVAEMELQAISERNRSAHRHNHRAGKYTGGVPPWGTLPAVVDGEWKLVQDPVQVQTIHEVVDRVLAGEPLRSIAHDMTRQGVLTPRDRFAQSQGREIRRYEWHSGPLKRSLTSPTLLGYTISHGEVVRGPDGAPVIRHEPILTREVFEKLGRELKDRERRKENTARSSALLLGVLFCGVCGKPMYKLKGGPGRKDRYRCASAQYKDRCANLTVPIEEADEVLTGGLLWLLEGADRPDRVWDAGSDHSAELVEVDAELTDLTRVLGTPAYRAGTPQRAALDRRIEALAERQQELMSLPAREPGWRWTESGEPFADWWSRITTTERNVFLRRMGVRITYKRTADTAVEWASEFMHLDRYAEFLRLPQSLRDQFPGL